MRAPLCAMFSMLLGISCATTGTKSGPPQNPELARAAVTKLLQEQYAAMERLDVEAWHAHHAPDVLWLGDEPKGDVHIGRDAVVAAMKVPYGQIKQMGGAVKVESSGLQIGVSPDGHAAWLADDVHERINAAGDLRPLSFRHTEVLAEREGQWWVVAEFWSMPLPNAKAAQMAGAGTMPTLEDIGDAVGPGAQPIAAAVDTWVAQPKAVVGQFADRADVIFYGNDPTERMLGGADIKKFLGQAFNNDGIKQARKGLRAGVTPNGQVGFAAYNLEAAAEMNNSTVVLPFRVMEVFVADGGAWKIVQLHMAHCVGEDVAMQALEAPMPKQAVAFPATPAGSTLQAWLDAFNSGEKARIEEFVQKYKHKLPAGEMLSFRNQTGGFTLLTINKSEPTHIEFMVQEKASPTHAIGKLDVKGEPPALTNFSLRAMPPGLSASDMVVKVDAAVRTRVIDGIVAKLNEFYVFPETATKMAATLREHQKKGAYDAITDGDAFATLLTEHLRDISHDKHLRVECVPMVLPKDSPREKEPPIDPQMRAHLERINCGFEKAERIEGNLGYVKFNMFAPVEVCGPKATAAMQALGDVDAIIFDLRDNGGGHPEMVAFVSSYLFDKRTHLNDLWERKSNKTTEYWTKDVPGRKFADKPVFVLVSNRTFSGAEEFTYNLKNLKRATIIGETTGGGAHPTGGHPVDDHFMIGVPFARAINPISKTNWEGTGVEPDVKVSADEALDVARKMAAEKIKKPRKK
jgi:ketosteroid isomerase-like protein